MREIKRSPDGRDALQAVWRYILLVARRHKPRDVAARLIAALGQEMEAAEMMTLEEMLNERIREEGREDERRDLLLTLLRGRFGALSDEIVARVNDADLAQLRQWFERAITAPTLDAALADA